MIRINKKLLSLLFDIGQLLTRICDEQPIRTTGDNIMASKKTSVRLSSFFKLMYVFSFILFCFSAIITENQVKVIVRVPY